MVMNKKILLSFVLIVGLGLAQAHEFWMQPVNFFLKPGEHLLVSFKVGEGFMGEPWDLAAHKIERLDLHRPTQSRNVIDSVYRDLKKNNLSLRLKDEGTYLLAMQSDNAFIAMEADKFNAYLTEDGLDDILDARKKTNTLDQPSKEYFRRHSKLLVQVGKKTDNTFSKVVGLPLEIIPEQNPYALKIGDPIGFKVLFEGKPLFGAKVRIWNRFENRTTLQNIYTEKTGLVETRVSNPGMWMVSVVKMVPSKQGDAEWQSHWASLVYGVHQ